MSEQRFHVIGMTDDQSGTFSAEILQLMGRGKVFSGGKRHHVHHGDGGGKRRQQHQQKE